MDCFRITGYKNSEVIYPISVNVVKISRRKPTTNIKHIRVESNTAIDRNVTGRHPRHIYSPGSDIFELLYTRQQKLKKKFIYHSHCCFGVVNSVYLAVFQAQRRLMSPSSYISL